MFSIRGATTIKENTVEEIKVSSLELFKEIIEKNDVKLEDIVSIFISCTKDVTKDYPGKFIREHYNLSNVAIMHFNEMEVENSLPLCVRFLILVNGNSDNINYVYLKEAKKLRTDLFNHN
ncbi:chorismate mutase [Clostridium sp. MSJ-11]|uniref:chorismate mutase n=1 Tax=Clostridium mobile TaxID=2841512 RepID=A0ABS6ECQ8_9CLOT|nr:chorismate mutase [Clostridium mobile]MBU5482825.1 chorismate mutase [Clostridium mobile]